jgi:glycerophosphoryl diester phosphodiesterase
MAIPLFAGENVGPFISAHRGSSSISPENTIPALQSALELGAHVAEVDIRMTRDGKLVLMHDRTLDRTTDGTGLVSNATLAEIRQLDAGRWFDRRFAGTKVPTLDEALAWSGGRLGLLLELKNFPERDRRFVPALIHTIRRNNADEFVVIAGFDHGTLKELHALEPSWHLEIITHCRMADWVHEARAAGAVLVSMEPEFVVQSDIEEMHASGLSVLTTLLSIEHGRELHALGIDFFESDDVRLARDAIRRLGRG